MGSLDYIKSEVFSNSESKNYFLKALREAIMKIYMKSLKI